MPGSVSGRSPSPADLGPWAAQDGDPGIDLATGTRVRQQPVQRVQSYPYHHVDRGSRRMGTVAARAARQQQCSGFFLVPGESPSSNCVDDDHEAAQLLRDKDKRLSASSTRPDRSRAASSSSRGQGRLSGRQVIMRTAAGHARGLLPSVAECHRPCPVSGQGRAGVPRATEISQPDGPAIRHKPSRSSRSGESRKLLLTPKGKSASSLLEWRQP